MKATTLLISLLFILLPVTTRAETTNHTSNKTTSSTSRQQIADALGWVPVPTSQNLCGGYYQQPKVVLTQPSPLAAGKTPTTITANHTTFLLRSGKSILVGNVIVTQPGRQITADKAYIYRDNRTGKITHIDLLGNVRAHEADKVIIGEQAHLDLQQNTLTVDQGAYRLSRPWLNDTVNAWGTAKQGIRRSSGIIDLSQATYSTCPPTTRAWQIKTSHLHLDKKSGRGRATNARLSLFNVPIFYLPYFDFPLDSRRKTGFLTPTFGYSNNVISNYVSGCGLSVWVL